jgi:hypothetical protein
MGGDHRPRQTVKGQPLAVGVEFESDQDEQATVEQGTTIQKAFARKRMSARTTRGTTWLVISPPTTTATTPKVPISSAIRQW